MLSYGTPYNCGFFLFTLYRMELQLFMAAPQAVFTHGLGTTISQCIIYASPTILVLVYASLNGYILQTAMNIQGTEKK